MLSIQRFYRNQCLGEQLTEIEANVAAIERSLGDGHNAEIEAYAVAIERLRDARIALKVAQGEAEQGRQRELLTQQLQDSVLRFKDKERCAEVGEGR